MLSKVEQALNKYRSCPLLTIKVLLLNLTETDRRYSFGSGVCKRQSCHTCCYGFNTPKLWGDYFSKRSRG